MASNGSSSLRSAPVAEARSPADIMDRAMESVSSKTPGTAKPAKVRPDGEPTQITR